MLGVALLVACDPWTDLLKQRGLSRTTQGVLDGRLVPVIMAAPGSWKPVMGIVGVVARPIAFILPGGVTRAEAAPSITGMAATSKLVDLHRPFVFADPDDRVV